MSGPLAYLWYEAAYALVFSTLTLGWSIRVGGRGNVPLSGPVLLIANHLSYFDPIMVGLGTRRHLSYLARKGLFDQPLFGALLRSLNTVPIDQDGFAKEGLQAILKQLKEGRPVLVFPEGSRSADGKLDELRPGIHLLIKRVGAPIVPVGLAGVFEAWPRSQLLPTPAPLFLPANGRTLGVSVGKPIDGQRCAKMPREAVLKELATAIQCEQEKAEKLRRR